MGKDHTHFYRAQGRERAASARGQLGQRSGKWPSSVCLSGSVCGGMLSSSGDMWSFGYLRDIY